MEGFQGYDDSGKLQFSTETTAFAVVNTASIASVASGSSFGTVTATLGSANDLVAFKSSSAVGMIGYQANSTAYKIITITPSCTVDVKILRPFTELSSSIDGFGMQLFTANAQLSYSALTDTAFVFGANSVYGENGIGDVGAMVDVGSSVNPYALVLGNHFVSYTGESGTDTIPRTIVISSNSSAILASSIKQTDWAGMPTDGGIDYSGTITIAAIY